MKLTLWMTTSVNGFIARPNNEEDYISHDSWLTWIKYLRQTGCVIWGRKTDEVVQTWGPDYQKDLDGIKVVVVSSNPNYQSTGNSEVVNSPSNALKLLKKQGFTEAALTGGAKLNTAFANLGLIDDIIVNLEPVIIGQGIPLFVPDFPDLRLQLVTTTKLTANFLQLHYRVLKK